MNTKSIDTDQIKRSVDCREVAARYSELRKQSSTESAGPCPFCGGTDRFRVFADHWFCRPDGGGHCGRKGDTIALIMQRENVDFRKACELLTGGVLPTTSTPAKPVKPIHKPNDWNEAGELQKAIDAHKTLMVGTGKYAQPSREYLQSRGLTLETAKAFKLGCRAPTLPGAWDDTKKTLSHPKQMAILLPWFNRAGSLVAVKYRFLETHEYTDKDGKQRTENKTSRGNFAGAMFGWQAVKGPTQNSVLIITEGEMNAPSLWQAGGGLVDVLSTGTESMMQTLPDEIIEFAMQYPYRIVWADKGEIADHTAIRIYASFSMPSPNGQDANDLLKADKLEKLLRAMLKKIGATVETPIVEASPILPSVEDITDAIGATVDPATWTALQAECSRRYGGQWTLQAEAVDGGYFVSRLIAEQVVRPRKVTA